MNELTISLNTVSKFPPFQEAKKWAKKHPSVCALGILAGIAFAAYRYSTQTPPPLPLNVTALSPKSFSSTPSISLVQESLAPLNPSRSIYEIANSPSVLAFIESTLVVNRLCTDPYQFYQECQHKKDKFSILLQIIKLCPCPKLNDKTRMQLEQCSIDLLHSSCPKGSPITLVSVGPGGCFQEVVYLAKLANSGYENINLVLIDTKSLDDERRKLALFCQLFLPKININIVTYTDLDAYVRSAKCSNFLIPNLLLLLDLTDEKHNIGNKSLPNYSFNLLRKNGLMQPKAVISYSTTITRHIPYGFFSFPKGHCCTYDGSNTELNDIQSDKKDFPVYPNGILYPPNKTKPIIL